MTELQDQIKELSDADFRDLKLWIITAETTRRQQEPAVRAGQQEIITGLQADGKLPRPEYTDVEDVTPEATFPDWVSPGTNHALMYPRGAVVRHNDRVWESRTDLNHWEPGGAGVYDTVWLDITHLTEQREAEDIEGEEGVEDAGGDEADEATETPTVTPFTPGLNVAEGDILEFEGDHYRVRSPHTTASHWPPNEAHSLFEKLEATQ